jgi:hypothetical protein
LRISSGNPVWSDDLGVTWTAGSHYFGGPTIRRLEFIPEGNSGVFIAFASQGGATVAAHRSTDRGVTWSTTNYSAAGCSASVNDFAYGNGIAIASSGYFYNGSYRSCLSRDGGATWERIPVELNTNGAIVFTAGKFYAIGQSAVHSSSDGRTWTTVPRTQRLSVFHPVALDDGSFVAVSQDYGSNYEIQRFLRSTDLGVTWVNADSFPTGHAINAIAYGETNSPCD